MDRERICRVVREQDELAEKRLGLKTEDGYKFCVLGACLHDLGLEPDVFAGYGTPGPLYIDVENIPDELLEEYPDSRVLPPEDPRGNESVNAATLLQHFFDITAEEMRALFSANDCTPVDAPADYVEDIGSLTGETAKERVLEFLNCQEVLE